MMLKDEMKFAVKFFLPEVEYTEPYKMFSK